jgi:hypothetical protein
VKHHLENYLWERIKDARSGTGRIPRDIIREMVEDGLIESTKQAHRTLEKWCCKNPPWYEYGVTLDLGWKLPEGRAHWKSQPV